MLTEKDYCDYETAWELCSLGYPEEDWCLLYSAQKWLREEKKIIVNIDIDIIGIMGYISQKGIIILLNLVKENLALMKKPFPKVSRKLLKF